MKNKVIKTSLLKGLAFGICLTFGAFFTSFDSYVGSLDPTNGMTSKIAQEIQYPEIAKMKKIEGTVWVEFSVNEEGKLDRIEALTQHGHGLETEVIETIIELEDSDQLKSGEYRVPVKFDIR